jgi:hypothetical protein
MTRSEAAEQQTLIAWARALSFSCPPLAYLHASLNGVRLSPNQARKASQQGMLAGIPDLFLPLPVAPYHGLFIELKTATGRLSPAQVSMLAYLNAQGYRAVCCRGWLAAKKEIESYLTK